MELTGVIYGSLKSESQPEHIAVGIEDTQRYIKDIRTALDSKPASHSPQVVLFTATRSTTVYYLFRH
jgi:hypothetical protein